MALSTHRYHMKNSCCIAGTGWSRAERDCLPNHSFHSWLSGRPLGSQRSAVSGQRSEEAPGEGVVCEGYGTHREGIGVYVYVHSAYVHALGVIGVLHRRAVNSAEFYPWRWNFVVHGLGHEFEFAYAAYWLNLATKTQ